MTAVSDEVLTRLMAERYGELPPPPPPGANENGPTACWMRYEDEREAAEVQDEIWRESEAMEDNET